jgi:hypothetical protein
MCVSQSRRALREEKREIGSYHRGVVCFMGLALQTQRDLWAAGVTAKDRKRIKRVATPEPSKVEHLPPSRRNSFATPSRGTIVLRHDIAHARPVAPP